MSGLPNGLRQLPAQFVTNEDLDAWAAHIENLEDQVKQITKQRDELLEFAEEVRRTGDTRLSSMAIATINKVLGEE